MENQKKPLEGVKVLELAQFMVGPVSCRILGEWGADVIKLERFKGDHQRVMGYLNNFPGEPEDNPAFDTVNLNKKFVGFNQRGPEANEIIDKMLAEADVFVTNYRNPVLKAMGLDYETLHEKYPRLVYGQVTGYGNAGKDKDEPGYDTVSWGARGGLIGTMQQEDNPPINIVPSLGDFICGMVLAGGIAGAVAGQALHGQGDKVTVSLYGLGIYGMGWPIMGIEHNEKPVWPRNRREVATPAINIYPTSDNAWFLLSCPDWGTYYDRIVTTIGREDLVDRMEYHNAKIMQDRGLVTEFIDLLDVEFKKHPYAYWKEKFDAIEVPIQKCNHFEDIYNDQQAWDAGFLYKYTTASGAEHTIANTPVQFDSIGLIPEHRPSRRVGGDTREVMYQFGYSDADIDAMIESGTLMD